MSGLVAAASFASTGYSAARPGPEPFPPEGARFGRSDLLIVTGAGVLAAWSTEFYDAGRTLEVLHRTGLDWPIDVANVYGDGLTLGAAALGLWALGRGERSPLLETTGSELSRSLVAAWTVTWALKLSVDARRPSGGGHSFPSGHTATAFAAAPVFHRNFGTTAGVVSYALATLTALARLEDEKHYLADVLVGAAIGTVAGRSVAPGGRLSIGASEKSRGLGVRLRF